MVSSLLKNTEENYSELWRDYWRTNWHNKPDWSPPERLQGFLSATAGRRPKAGRLPEKQEIFVYDYPSGQRPFLGAITQGFDGNVSDDAGVLEYPAPGHLLTIAPTRSGKGVSHIIPNLLFYSGSAVVIDIKGENYSITAKRRETIFESARVVKFAPFMDETDCYNPLDFVRIEKKHKPSSYTFDDSRLLVDMLLPTKEKEEYWDIEARNLLTALILFVACKYAQGEAERNMRSVVNLLFSEPDLDGGQSGIQQVCMDLFIFGEESNYTPLKALAASLTEHEEKVRNNIVSTCRAGMQVWLSERLLAATDKSDFQFIELMESMCRPIDENPAPTTIYVIIPPEYLNEYRSVLRMITGLAAVELTRSPPWKDKTKWRNEPPCPVMFILDEFPALGHMKPIADGMAYLAGYNVQLWIFAQNIGQLKTIYGNGWENFPANSAVTSFFGVNDPDTAEYIERLLGETPEYLDEYLASGYASIGSTGYSSSSGLGNSSSTQNLELLEKRVNHRHTKTKIAPASEIRAMSEKLQLVFIRNTKPILASKIPHYKFELLEGLYETWEK